MYIALKQNSIEKGNIPKFRDFSLKDTSLQKDCSR